jgi:hypothetical protein
VRNVLDLKYLSGGEERKANNVFTWNMSGSFDPEASERRFSQIRSSIRTSIGPIDNISLNHTYDPYEREIVSTSLSAGISLGGGFSYPAVWKLPEHEKLAAAKDLVSGLEEPVPPAPGTDEYGDFEQKPVEQIPPGPSGGPQTGNRWTLSIGYSYSAFGGAASGRPTSKIDMRGTLFFTKRWKLSWSAYYDIENREFTTQQYSLDCDLHCWEAGFVHRRFGTDTSYYFQIRIKAHRDIQYEQGKRGLGSSVPGFL